MATDDKPVMQPPGGGFGIRPSPAAATDAAAPRKQWEDWAEAKSIPHWKADAARHGRQWPLGQEVTEAEFDQAIYDAFNSRIG